MDRDQATGKATVARKRKAEGQDNERLSKRLALLNLERSGEKKYVHVEEPQAQLAGPAAAATRPFQFDDDVMQLDDTKHKVYIYDLDAELSDSESDDGKLVFLPDIDKHLRATRLPPSILANNEGELAGNNQLVLYNIPSSLTIPEEQDSVRKAIIETRARARARQSQKSIEELIQADSHTAVNGTPDARTWYHNMVNGHAIVGGDSAQVGHGFIPASSNGSIGDDDPDAMDIG